MKLLIAVMFFCSACLAQQKITVSDPASELKDAITQRCDMAVVDWKDAVIYTRREVPDPRIIDEMLPVARSIGCVAKTPNSVFVIHSFVNAKPTEYTIIPKQWVMKVTFMGETEPPSKEEKK